MTELWLPVATGSVPLLEPVTGLPEQARALVPGCDWMLLCPLALRDQPSGDPLIGVLAVFGEQRVLADLAGHDGDPGAPGGPGDRADHAPPEIIRQGNEAYFRTLVQDTSDVILIVADDGTVRYATPSAASIFGDIAVEGAQLKELVADAEGEEVAQLLARLRTAPHLSSRYVDRRIIRRDGVTVQVEVKSSDLRDDPTVAGLVLTLRDVTEQRQLEEQLKHQAFHDALTGLPNRLLFQERIWQQLTAARRDGRTAGVLFVDLDDFKVVNDTMGHGVGDELLAAIGGAAVRAYPRLRHRRAARR